PSSTPPLRLQTFATFPRALPFRTMTCQRVRELFPDLLDQRVPASTQVEARAHLAACPDCQLDFSSLAQTASALDGLPAPQPSPRLRQNFRGMLEEEKRAVADGREPAAETARGVTTHRRLPWRRFLSPLARCALLPLAFFAGQ